MQKRLQLSIKKRLNISFLILLLIPSLAIGLLSYQTARQKVQDQVLDQAKGNTHLLDQLVIRLIEPELQNVTLLAENVNANMYAGRQSPRVMEMIHQFQRLHPEIASAYVGTEAGFLIMDGSEKLEADYDVRKRPWYQQGRQSDTKPVITDPYVDKITGQTVVSLLKKTKDGSGVVGIDLNLSKLAEMTSSIKIGKQGYVFMIDQQKKILVHPSSKNGADAPKEIVAQLFSKPSGSYDTRNNTETTRTFFVTNELTGWKLGGTINMAEVTAEANPIFTTTVVVITAALLLGGLLVYVVISSITRPLRLLDHASEVISSGDLTERVLITSNDELGQLGQRFNQMGESLQHVLHDVREKAEHLAAASEELMQGAKETSHAVEHVSTTIQEIAAGSEQQVQSVEDTSNTIIRMSGSMQQIAEHAQQTSASVAETSDVAANGTEAIQLAIQQMDLIHTKITRLSDTISSLEERSHEIENFVGIITGIAAQTNLLSLNAAIEAARAGEQGRGFAVVADEVRQLAEQSSQSANHITSLIQTIQNETKAAVDFMEDGVQEVKKGIDAVYVAGQSFQSIRESIEHAAEQVYEVSSSAQEMSAGAETVARSIEIISEIAERSASGMETASASTEEQLASMEEISASAEALAHMAEGLEEVIQRFNV
ncbi:methyl-accepting chemotaxis protein [Aneurinibacillus soli]|uniref:Methyl-accepting chemotaxis protein McpB n=1 Tax=Aneurinibacillus soli TaxID=1500254 RepID=A0A0U5B4A9_9BACL|nr:methyl-accepting chemotaxis protein [Aneurinibacillus soli]PYE58514.1 methyl-accepting chemotaxis protein [Aneurinibacillus soli]BAU29490.1 Methyl-accepting chemotaxis protein McpB [Aneurinibacillus soli]